MVNLDTTAVKVLVYLWLKLIACVCNVPD